MFAALCAELNQKFEEQHDLKVKFASRSQKLQQLWDLTAIGPILLSGCECSHDSPT
jgi:hypothetical protein